MSYTKEQLKIIHSNFYSHEENLDFNEVKERINDSFEAYFLLQTLSPRKKMNDFNLEGNKIKSESALDIILEIGSKIDQNMNDEEIIDEEIPGDSTNDYATTPALTISNLKDLLSSELIRVIEQDVDSFLEDERVQDLLLEGNEESPINSDILKNQIIINIIEAFKSGKLGRTLNLSELFNDDKIKGIIGDIRRNSQELEDKTITSHNDSGDLLGISELNESVFDVIDLQTRAQNHDSHNHSRTSSQEARNIDEALASSGIILEDSEEKSQNQNINEVKGKEMEASEQKQQPQREVAVEKKQPAATTTDTSEEEGKVAADLQTALATVNKGQVATMLSSQALVRKESIQTAEEVQEALEIQYNATTEALVSSVGFFVTHAEQQELDHQERMTSIGEEALQRAEYLESITSRLKAETRTLRINIESKKQGVETKRQTFAERMAKRKAAQQNTKG